MGGVPEEEEVETGQTTQPAGQERETEQQIECVTKSEENECRTYGQKRTEIERGNIMQDDPDENRTGKWQTKKKKRRKVSKVRKGQE